MLVVRLVDKIIYKLRVLPKFAIIPLLYNAKEKLNGTNYYREDIFSTRRKRS